jgi:hypothetical protein
MILPASEDISHMKRRPTRPPAIRPAMIPTKAPRCRDANSFLRDEVFLPTS